MSHTDILNQIQQLGKQILPEDAHLLLCGSLAHGDYYEGSYWDLLILLNRPQEASDFQNIVYPIMELGFDMGEYFQCTNLFAGGMGNYAFFALLLEC